jgi:Asp-tRNA(Asn)/Glu-tRNA(Gln) amidotransferase C subunit
MEEKTAKDIATQLKRIADALDKQNTLEEKKLKSEDKINKLQEKKLRSDLRESTHINEDKVIKVRPNFKGQ